MYRHWSKEFQIELMNKWNPKVDSMVHRVVDEKWILSGIKYMHHAFWYIVQGKGSCKIWGDNFTETYEVSRGDLIYFEPGNNVDILVNNGIEYYTVHFDISETNHNFSKSASSCNNNHMVIKVIQTQSITKLFGDICEVWCLKSFGYGWKSKLILMQIIDKIIEELKALNPSQQIIVEKIIEHMIENKHQNLDLEGFSRQINKSQSYIIRIFKSVTGFTPIYYYNKLKMDEAKTLLISTNVQIRDIAHELGYTDQYYFSRIFKKMEGFPPSYYRKARR